MPEFVQDGRVVPAPLGEVQLAMGASRTTNSGRAPVVIGGDLDVPRLVGPFDAADTGAGFPRPAHGKHASALAARDLLAERERDDAIGPRVRHVDVEVHAALWAHAARRVEFAD